MLSLCPVWEYSPDRFCFVPGDMHSTDTGARHSPGRRHQACACLSPSHHVQEHTPDSPYRSGESQTTRKGVYRSYSAEVRSANRRWEILFPVTRAPLFTLQPSSPNLFLPDRSFHPVSQGAGGGNHIYTILESLDLNHRLLGRKWLSLQSSCR